MTDAERSHSVRQPELSIQRSFRQKKGSFPLCIENTSKRKYEEQTFPWSLKYFQYDCKIKVTALLVLGQYLQNCAVRDVNSAHVIIQTNQSHSFLQTIFFTHPLLCTQGSTYVVPEDKKQRMNREESRNTKYFYGL